MMILFGLFILGGTLAGFTAGLFGIGGGCFLIPLFLYLLPKLGTSEAQIMHQAVATSLAIIIPSTLSASYEQYKLKHLDITLIKRWIPPVLIGLISATLSLQKLNSMILKIIFVVYLLGCAAYMFISKNHITDEDQPRPISKLSNHIAGFSVGFLSVILGIGGGTFTTPYFTKYHYPLKKAIAISSLTGVFIGIIGTISMIIAGWHAPGLAPFSFGYVNLFACIITSPFSLICAGFGAKIGNMIPSKTLNLLYIGFLLCVAGYVALHISA